MARSVLRYLADWRNGLTFAATVLVALLALVTIDGISGRRQAVDALRAQSRQALSAQQAASRRIDLLNGQIETLNAQAEENGQTIGELVGDMHALEQQVRDLGARPVVTVPTTTTTTRPPVTTTTAPRSTTTTTAAGPSSTTTTVPTTTTTTSKHCVIPINPSCKP